MRAFHFILPCLAILASAVAQTKPDAEDLAAPAISAREIALNNLLSERDSDKALTTAIEAARKNGISEQSILEGRFLYHIDRREDDAIAEMLPDFLKRREDFKLVDSSIFNVKEDWLAVVEYVQAIAALKKGDKDGFKSHILEAFWLSPKQASAFAPQIERLRLEDAMRNVRIDFESRFIPVAGGDPVPLKDFMKGKKAMLLHFWSPSSRESGESLPDYLATAKALGDKGIAMVSVMPEDPPQLLTDARAMIKPLETKAAGAWVVDRREGPLARELRVQGLPVFVLVSGEGKVLYNGDPSEEEFWDALKKVDARIIRPQSPDSGE